MLRSSLYTAGALLICASAYGQDTALMPGHARGLRPITAPVQHLEGTLDLRTGKFVRTRNTTIGDDGKQEVYDNTCATGFYIGLEDTIGTGSAFPETMGDFGAIPSLGFPGDAICTTGCADDYDITQFEIAWCQLAGPVGGSVIELDFWNTPQASCQVGTAPGNNPTGGVRPPATSTVLSATLAGLPRNNMIGTLACYFLNITLVTPGFNLSGSSTFVPATAAGDKFAWGFTMPTTTGSDGPILAGNLTPFTSPCAPCQGTIWEVGGQTTNAGTGGGQDNHVFWEDYGGTSIPSGSGDCYFFGSQVPTGLHLELFSNKPCDVGVPSVSFCDAGDGSLASCPCANPGLPNTGCDTPIPGMAGGGLTGGVGLVATTQVFTPQNRATLTASGFPVASTPAGVVMRNNGIDPGSPVVFGDGLRCVDTAASPTTFTRIGAAAAAGGTSQHTFGHGAMAGVGTFFYQLWFRSTPQSYCDPVEAFSLSNGVTLDW
jgi:hypothetical protein